MTNVQRPTSSRAIIPFLLTSIVGLKEQSIAPLNAPANSFVPDPFHVIKFRLSAATFPFANRRLIDASDPRELALRYAKNLRSDVFDGIHTGLYMPFGILCQYAVGNLYYSEWHV